jgi:hypothetical protein
MHRIFLKGKQKVGRGGFYMDSYTDKAKILTNGAILIISTVLKHAMSLAAEEEIGAVFLNAKEGTVLRITLEELGHPHPPTPLQTDTTTATGYRIQKWDNKTKMHTSHGYALLLGKRQG